MPLLHHWVGLAVPGSLLWFIGSTACRTIDCASPLADCWDLCMLWGSVVGMEAFRSVPFWFLQVLSLKCAMDKQIPKANWMDNPSLVTSMSSGLSKTPTSSPQIGSRTLSSLRRHRHTLPCFSIPWIEISVSSYFLRTQQNYSGDDGLWDSRVLCLGKRTHRRLPRALPQIYGHIKQLLGEEVHQPSFWEEIHGPVALTSSCVESSNCNPDRGGFLVTQQLVSYPYM